LNFFKPRQKLIKIVYKQYLLQHNEKNRGVLMNKYMITVTVTTLLSLSSFAKVENPTRHKDGFTNVNSRKEYNYHQSPNENIWHEFGRPFWNTAKTQKTTEAATPVKTAPIVTAVLDDDQDKVTNNADHCPNTPKGHKVNALGCSIQVKERITLDVKFTLNKAQIKSNYTTDIDKLAAALKRNKDLRIEIQGHTDTTGTTAYNKILSQSRSNTVRQYLIQQHGISPMRLEAKGYGQADPMATNSTLEGRRTNRRVEIKVLN